MSSHADITSAHPAPMTTHLENVADNLQLVADLGYGDVALAVVSDPDATLAVVADARPVTASAAVAASHVGKTLSKERETEVFEALASGEVVRGSRRRIARGIGYSTSAYPLGSPGPTGESQAVIVRNVTVQVSETSGAMETQFIQAAEDLIALLRSGPLRTPEGEPFSTTRVAGDGMVRFDDGGRVVYASPNAVNIMRLAGLEGPLIGAAGTALPGGRTAVAPIARHGAGTAASVEVAVEGRVLGYRVVRLDRGAFALVEDRTEARRREQEIKVKEATIREVHHRVKNNLQTIASLLRIQARRAKTDEVRRALGEATERVSSMAVVHDMLAVSTEERIDFAEAARTVVDLVRQGLAGESEAVAVDVEGSTGSVPSHVATSLALVVAELVHNAIEHGFPEAGSGTVSVSMRRLPREGMLVVRDDGRGMPPGFDFAGASTLGLSIVRTIVEDNLHGTISFSGARGTTVTVRFPLEDVPGPGEE